MLDTGKALALPHKVLAKLANRISKKRHDHVFYVWIRTKNFGLSLKWSQNRGCWGIEGRSMDFTMRKSRVFAAYDFTQLSFGRAWVTVKWQKSADKIVCQLSSGICAYVSQQKWIGNIQSIGNTPFHKQTFSESRAHKYPKEFMYPATAIKKVGVNLYGIIPQQFVQEISLNRLYVRKEYVDADRWCY